MLRVGIHQNHQIVSETRVLQVSVGSATGDLLSPLQHLIHLVQVQIAEQGGKHSTLRDTLLTCCLDDQFQQVHDLRVVYPSRDFLQQDLMPDVVERTLDTLPTTITSMAIPRTPRLLHHPTRRRVGPYKFWAGVIGEAS